MDEKKGRKNLKKGSVSSQIVSRYKFEAVKFPMDFQLNYGWTKSAKKILQQMTNLVENAPAMMFLRHSQREEPEKGVEMKNFWLSSELATQLNRAVLTEEGRQGAVDFGYALPSNRTYRIYHSPFTRCAETAQSIYEGIHHHTTNVEMKGELAELLDIKCDEVKKKEYTRKDGFLFFENWLSGRYPPNEMSPLIDYAKQVAEKVKHIAQSAQPQTFDIYITHDFHIIVLLFYWASLIQLSDSIHYLDGFILQLIDNKMYFYYRRGKKEIDLPYWWKS